MLEPVVRSIQKKSGTIQSSNPLGLFFTIPSIRKLNFESWVEWILAAPEEALKVHFTHPGCEKEPRLSPEVTRIITLPQVYLNEVDIRAILVGITANSLSFQVVRYGLEVLLDLLELGDLDGKLSH